VEGLEVVRKLAEGSAVEAFFVRDARSQKNSILELLRNEVVTDVELCSKLLEQTRQHLTLSHPHLIARQRAQQNAQGGIYILSEPMAGVPLSSVLKERGKLSVSEVIDLMTPLCDAMFYLHALGLKHGNLCPDHVMVEPGNLAHPWLFDTLLTLTRSVPARHEASKLVKSEYLAPERIKGRRGTAASDIYGLGVLMYELLTGQPPFSGANSLETRRLHLEAKPPPLPDEVAGLAPVIMRCLAKEQLHRFPDAKTLSRALRATGGATKPGNDTITMDVSTLGQLKAQATFFGNEGKDGGERQAASGEKLGEYELIDLLGQGGMGRVFLARHLKSNNEVALKVLRAEMAKDPTNLRRFVHEATVVSRIHHPHIVEVYDLVQETDCIYCVMEPLRGRTLGETLQEHPISIKRALGIMRQVCEALDAAHRVGVVHRDVKPDNIFLCERPKGEDDFIKLLDFGVAKQQNLSEAPDAPKSLWQTQGGVMVGTPMYMAPEQALGEGIDARTDIYTVATVLYRVLSGDSPFRAPKLHALIAQLLTQPPPPLPEHTSSGESIPKELAVIVMRCLDKRPEGRLQTMDELALALALIESSLPHA
jgi:serine/threonine protein kinase